MWYIGWSIALMITCGGCTKVGPCKSGTLLVDLMLTGASSAADQLVVSVSVDNDTPVVNPPIAYSAGMGAGTLEIDFPSGYPQGKTVTVDVAALQKGASVGEQSKSVTLPAGCGLATLTITGALGGGGTPPSDDMLADVADGNAPSPNPDMGCMPATTENCFNGIDDDCNGLVDCADPACAPVATCVPAVAGASYGTVLSGSPPPSCPQPNAVTQMLYGDFANGNNGCTGCSSTASGTPTVTLYGDPSCGSAIGSVTGNNVCSSPMTLSSSGQLASVTLSGVTCSAPTRTAHPMDITTDKFCVSPTVGSGCAAGNVCVPKVGTDNTCVMVNSTESCAAIGYPHARAPSSGTWYTDKVDSRQCSACSITEPQMGWMLCLNSGKTPDCTGPCSSGTTANPSCESNNGVSASYSLQTFTASCSASATFSGSVAGAGSQKNVCCM